MKFTTKHRKQLRRLGHQLSPVVRIAQDGLKETVIGATEEALEAHELIKIKILSENRDERIALLNSLCRKTGATLVSQTGFTALLFRRNPESPRINLGQKAVKRNEPR